MVCCAAECVQIVGIIRSAQDLLSWLLAAQLPVPSHAQPGWCPVSEDAYGHMGWKTWWDPCAQWTQNEGLAWSTALPAEALGNAHFPYSLAVR